VVAASVLVLTALVGGCSASSTSEDATEAVTSSPVTPAPPTVTVDTAQRVGSATPEAPVSLTLPSGDEVPVRAVSTTANGVLDVPEEIDDAGWWRGGSKIGDPFGSVLVAAHVDSRTEGLGPFAELLSVRSGQRVVVRTEGLRQTYEIHSLRLRPRGVIGAGAYLHSPDGRARLTLVTCAGPYDAARGGYQDLAVVTAHPVGEPRPRSGATP
jgi:hypothetical protein